MDSGADGDSLNRVMLARTSGEPIRFHGLEQELAGDALEMALVEFLALDRGYLELRLSGQDYPVLTMGFDSQLAVIDCFRSQDQMALLHGDGSKEAYEVVHVPVYDEFASFTGAFAMTLGRARETLLRFARGTPITALGQWFEL